jgi:hypothetical protein
MIAIIFEPEFTRLQFGRHVAAAVSGIEAAVPSSYDATLQEILEALSEWRVRYRSSSSQVVDRQESENPPRSG